MSNALVVKNLNKSFLTGIFGKKRQILKNVNFSVPKGSITGFVGVNGSGKTTTIKCLLKFIFPDDIPEMSISFFGDENFSMKIREKLAYLPERPYLPEQLTAEEFLFLHWKLGPWKKSKNTFEAACKKVLLRVNLPRVEKNFLRGFSKGMLQRICLAQALLYQPDFFIFDEPMSGLDPDGRRLVKDIILEEQARGATIFFTSHLLADMDELCTHLVVIDQGEIHFSGPVEDFTHSESKTSVLTYLDAQQRRQQDTISKDELSAKISEILKNQGQILRLNPVETSIERVFTERKWLEEKNQRKEP